MLGRLFRPKTVLSACPQHWDLSDQVLRLSCDDVMTIRDLVAGTVVFGATSGGKTSGAGRTLAISQLKAGFGGLVLTAKSDERALWESYCRETGRLSDLLIIGPDAKLRFNFLDHELNRKGVGAGLTENIVTLFSHVIENHERNSSASGDSENGGFFRQNGLKAMRGAVDLSAIATGEVSVERIVDVLRSAPLSAAQIRDREWQDKSACFQYLVSGDRKEKGPRQQHDFGVVADQFLIEWPRMPDKTRGSILATVLGWTDLLQRGLLRELFCTDTTITPEAVEDGKIILIDLPVKEFGEVGQFAQVLFKYCFQRSIERRNVAESPRPVFLWADEAQHFITSYDMQFQTTCRSALVATVNLTQNVSNVYAALGGGDKGRAEADSLFANLNMKIFHANGDPVTNEWAASLIGRSRQFLASGNSSYDNDHRWAAAVGLDWLDGGGSTSAGFSETFEYEVQPREFTRLRTGGPANGWIVDGIVFQNGRTFAASGKTWLKTAFRQRP